MQPTPPQNPDTTDQPQPTTPPKPSAARGGLRWLWIGLIVLSVAGWGWAIYTAHLRYQPIPLPPITEEELAKLTPAALPNMCLQDQGRARIAQWRAEADKEALAQLDVLLFTTGCFDLLTADEQRAFITSHLAWTLPQAERVGFALESAFLLDILTSSTAPWSARQHAAALLTARVQDLEPEQRTLLLTTASGLIEHPWAISVLDAFGEPAATPLLWEHHKRLRAELEAEAEAAKAAAKKKKDPPKNKPPEPQDPPTDKNPENPENPENTENQDPPEEPDETSPTPPTARLGVYSRAQLLELLTPRLFSQWKALPDEARTYFILERWLSTRWIMHKSGSISQIQPLMLEVKWKGFDLPPPLTDSVLWMRVESITIEDQQKKKPEPVEVTLPEGLARDQFGAVVFDEPTHWRRAVNLQPLLTEKGAYKIAASLEVALLPAEARGQTVSDDKGLLTADWRAKALWTHKISLPKFTYRTYLGVDSGMPKTTREPKIGRQITQRLDVRLHTTSGDVILRDKGKNKKHPAGVPYPYEHAVNNEIILEASSPIDTHLSFRLHGLPNNDPTQEWLDLGGGVLMQGDTLAIWPVNLSPVCPLVGPCKTALRLRASLKTARPDPRIDKYWGDNVELGPIEFDIANSGDTHHWVELQRHLSSAIKSP